MGSQNNIKIKMVKIDEKVIRKRHTFSQSNRKARIIFTRRELTLGHVKFHHFWTIIGTKLTYILIGK